jgi:hypothetical protein
MGRRRGGTWLAAVMCYSRGRHPIVSVQVVG